MIALDAHGADGGAAVVAAGARLAGLPVLAFGPPAELRGLPAGSEAIEAPAVPGGEPALAVRSNPDSSVVRGAVAVAEGRAEALVSAGSTGATLAASVFHVKRLRGVHRPAIAALIPLPAGRTLLLDAGANAEVRPEYLVQFAHMGAAFMEAVHGVERPTVGLLNVGEEPGKGTSDVIEAHETLAGGDLNFVGNVEGGDLASGGRGCRCDRRVHRQRGAQDDGGNGQGRRTAPSGTRSARVWCRASAGSLPGPGSTRSASAPIPTAWAGRSCWG